MRRLAPYRGKLAISGRSGAGQYDSLSGTPRTPRTTLSSLLRVSLLLSALSDEEVEMERMASATAPKYARGGSGNKGWCAFEGLADEFYRWTRRRCDRCRPLTGWGCGGDGCGCVRELESEGKRKEFALCGGEEEGEQ
jgi:hypothetical protein